MTTIAHSVLVFVAVMAVLRIMGKRELSQMSAFELVTLFVIGDLVAESLLAEDTSITGAMTATATFALLTVFLSWVSYRWPRTRPLVDGAPCVVVVDGVLDKRIMRRERLTIDDVREAARTSQIRDIDDIELGLLEPDGSFSFFTRSG